MGAEPVARGATVAGRAALAGIAGFLLLVVLAGLLGPSAAQPALGVPTGLPPYSFDTRPEAWTMVWLLGSALLLGAVSFGAALVALRKGWRPCPRRLLLAGVLATCALAIVPPMGSADHLSYVAYGRVAALGFDPYAVTPSEAAADGDPVVAAAEPPWEDTTSVYGPVTTMEQELASHIGGTSVRTTILVLAVVNALAFLLTAVLLYRATRGDPARQRRAMVLWSVNPLLLYAAVNGLHVDTLMVALLVAAVLAVRRSPVASGVLLAVAMAVKLPAALGAAGIAWALCRRFRTLLLTGGVSVLVFAGLYATAGPHAFDQLYRASRYISLATPGRLLAETIEPLIGHGPTRLILRILGVVALLVVAALLLRWAHRRWGPAGTGPMPEPGPLPDERLRTAVWVTGALGIAWLFTAPYALPWYDAFGWAFLALLPASRLDGLFLVRGIVLSLAYVPGRTTLPEDVRVATLFYRAEVAPYLTTALLIAALVVIIRIPGRSPAALPSRQV